MSDHQIWNATIVSQNANGYVIASAPYNGQIGTNGDTSFGFTVNGQVDPTAISVNSVDTQSPVIPTTPTTPSSRIVTSDPNHMFSPYIDMAMTQDDDLVAISQASGIENFTLAFIRTRTRASAGRARDRSPMTRWPMASRSCSRSRRWAATSPSPSVVQPARRRH